MSVPVTREPHSEPLMENCCICRIVTAYWTAIPNREPGEQVALCINCSVVAEFYDIPNKMSWCRRERIARRELR